MPVDNSTLNAGVTRIIVYGALAVLVGYDALAFMFGWKTITVVCRELDFQTGTLLRWLLLGIWLHLFVVWGSAGYGK